MKKSYVSLVAIIALSTPHLYASERSNKYTTANWLNLEKTKQKYYPFNPALSDHMDRVPLSMSSSIKNYGIDIMEKDTSSISRQIIGTTIALTAWTVENAGSCCNRSQVSELDKIYNKKQ